MGVKVDVGGLGNQKHLFFDGEVINARALNTLFPFEQIAFGGAAQLGIEVDTTTPAFNITLAVEKGRVFITQNPILQVDFDSFTATTTVTATASDTTATHTLSFRLQPVLACEVGGTGGEPCKFGLLLASWDDLDGVFTLSSSNPDIPIIEPSTTAYVYIKLPFVGSFSSETVVYDATSAAYVYGIAEETYNYTGIPWCSLGYVSSNLGLFEHFLVSNRLLRIDTANSLRELFVGDTSGLKGFVSRTIGSGIPSAIGSISTTAIALYDATIPLYDFSDADGNVLSDWSFVGFEESANTLRLQTTLNGKKASLSVTDMVSVVVYDTSTGSYFGLNMSGGNGVTLGYKGGTPKLTITSTDIALTDSNGYGYTVSTGILIGPNGQLNFTDNFIDFADVQIRVGTPAAGVNIIDPSSSSGIPGLVLEAYTYGQISFLDASAATVTDGLKGKLYVDVDGHLIWYNNVAATTTTLA